jgi:N-acetyl-gamma-glutamyl-phosphate reductase/acetylglutamate kinase
VVIKVGGAVLDQIDELALSLSFLYRVSLSWLIYGAGPQLNEIMELEGVIPDYVQGICVTGKHVLSSNERS